ncbi:hypothetical protein KKB11_04710 [Candidatus Micrarchaeota archaeon]|nr:hypothetical protein [Candidatus Micrarchaeota archaeon]
MASGILMIFLGLSALIKIKVEGTELKEKKSEIKKGIYFSVAGIFFGLIIKKIIGFDFLNFNFIEFDFTVEMILLLLLVLVLKEVYSQKKDKWINAFVLMGTFLVCSGSLVVFTEVLSQINLI